MKFCVSCETDSVIFGKTKIKVGRETFETAAEHCTNCTKVAITPKLQKQIDQWALQFTKSIVELQPYFTKDMFDRVEFLSDKYNLSKADFMKVCTTFYILEMTKIGNFKVLRDEVLTVSQRNYKREFGGGEIVTACYPLKILRQTESKKTATYRRGYASLFAFSLSRLFKGFQRIYKFLPSELAL